MKKILLGSLIALTLVGCNHDTNANQEYEGKVETFARNDFGVNYFKITDKYTGCQYLFVSGRAEAVTPLLDVDGKTVRGCKGSELQNKYKENLK